MERQTSFKSPYLLILTTAILLSTANMLLAPSIMSLVEQWMRANQLLLRFVDASPPYVSQDEHGNVAEHPLDLNYRVNRFFHSHFFSIVMCFAAGIVVGSTLGDHWLRFAFVFSVLYCFAPFLFAPLNLLILFTGFDAATPMDIWLQEFQSLAIVASSTILGAWIGSRYKRRQNRVRPQPSK